MQFLENNSKETNSYGNLVSHINMAHRYLDDQVDKVCYTDMVDNIAEIYGKTLAKLNTNRHEGIISNKDVFNTNLFNEIYKTFNGNYSTADYGMFINDLVELFTINSTGSNNRFIKYNYMLEPNIFKYDTQDGLNTKINITVLPAQRELFTTPWHKELLYLLQRVGIKETLIILTLVASSRVKKAC